VKNLLLNGAHKTKLLELGRIMRRNKIAILCYHRFTSSPISDGALSASLFESHLKYLKKHFTPVSFKQIHHVLEGRLQVRNPLIMTVDDGYKDFADVAFPLLEKYRIPATLFVTTRFADGEMWLWPDVVTYSIRETSRAMIESPDSGPDLPLLTPVEKDRARNRLLAICKQMDNEEKLRFLADLAARLEIEIPSAPTPDFQSASWEDLRGLDKTLLEIGSHTLTHPILSRVSPESARREIAESKKQIERELDVEVNAFAYPNGFPEDYEARHKEMLKESGYKYAVSCNFGFNAYDADMLELNRIVAPSEIPRFVQEVSGFEDLKRQIAITAKGGRAGVT
jgi:peptidoglycan/xylan/chitin deacetylase (PgdA/CDA1 family)